MGGGGRGGAGAEDAAAPSNRFKDFAFQEDDMADGAVALAGAPDRGAPKAFVSKVSGRLQQGGKGAVAEKVITLLDSDDDVGWMEAKMSPRQVERNQSKAIEDRKRRTSRKTPSNYVIPKRKKVIESDDDSEAEAIDDDDDDESNHTDENLHDNDSADDDDLIDSPEPTRNIQKRPRDKDNFPIYEAAASDELGASPEGGMSGIHAKKAAERAERLAARTNKRAAGSKKRIVESGDESGEASDSEEEEPSGKNRKRAGQDDDSDDDSEADVYAMEDEGATKDAIKLGADKVLQKCRSLSETLRNAIQRWDNSMDGADKNGCLNLTAMRSSSASSGDDNQKSKILTVADFPFLTERGLALKDYQYVGVNWMRLLHESVVNGGVLADDMGLGKTVQVIAFLGWLQRSARILGKEPHAPHLIVVPASTLSNWALELERCCPALRVLTYHGSQANRSDLRHDWSRAESAFDRRRQNEHACDVLLTTYTYFERESSASDRSFLYKQNFSYLILDEAHCIKNSDGNRFENLARLACGHRLLLSGTPVQNKLSELLALLSFLMPHVFRKHSCNLLLQSFNWKNEGKENDHASILLLRKMLVPFVLRRLKADVLDQLVAKSVAVKKLSMVPNQILVYDSIIAGYIARKDRETTVATATKRDELFWSVADDLSKGSRRSASLANATQDTVLPEKGKKAIVDLTDGELGKSAALPPPDKEILDVNPAMASVLSSVAVSGREFESMPAKEARHLFTALRKAANHPLLLRVRFRDDAVLNRVAKAAMVMGHFGSTCTFEQAKEEIVTNFSDLDIHHLCAEYPEVNGIGSMCLDVDTLFDSPKFQWLSENLPRIIQEGHHVLIFSQWTRILDLLELLMHNLSYYPSEASLLVAAEQPRAGSAAASAAPRKRTTIIIDSDDEASEEINIVQKVEAPPGRSAAPLVHGIPFLRLDGSTPVGARQNLINRFNTGAIPVFLLSTKAGGQGINLTQADTVIMHDLDFNPENDRQAEDRVHRIGQLRSVQVYKLVTETTVDDDIFAMGERKRELSQALLSSAKGKGKKGADDDDVNTIGTILQSALMRRTLGGEAKSSAN